MYFLFIYNKIFRFKTFYIIILISIIFCLSIFYQKYNIYGAKSLYFLHPFLFDFDSNFLNFLEKIKLSNNYKFFPLNLFIPLSKNALLEQWDIFFFYNFLFYFTEKNSKKIFLFF